MKKFLAMALALLMVAVLLPVTAMAEENAAKIGDTEYATLQGAINAAADGATVKLLKDVVLEQIITVEKSITLDMDGKKLSNTEDLWNESAGNWSLISVRSGGNLTITGNGTFAAKENDCFAVDVQDGATVTIENGTFIGNIHAVYVNKGTANVNGGTYSVQQKYTDPAKADEFVLNCLDDNRATGDAKIIVTGGTFIDFNPADCAAEGAGTNFVAAGYEVKANGNVYTVVRTPIVFIVPGDTTDTTTTTEKPANPATGANDFVGAAAALAVVSLLGMAAVTRKK